MEWRRELSIAYGMEERALVQSLPRVICCKKPPQGSVSLNVDGTCFPNPSSAGNFLRGFYGPLDIIISLM